MSPVEAERGGAMLQGLGAESAPGGLRAPGLDVAALWREVFAVEAGNTAPWHAVAAMDAPPAAVRGGGAAGEGSGMAAPRDAAHGLPQRPSPTAAKPGVPHRAASVTPRPPAAPSIVAGKAQAARVPAAEDRPCLSETDPPRPAVGSVRAAAPSEAGRAARAPVSTGLETGPRTRPGEPSIPDCAAGATARVADAGRAASPPGPREFVQVRCHEGAVLVLVRDPGLAPADAIRCSLEAAYALRGERAALRQVRLNGRTVFERPGPATSAGGGPPGRLCFAC